MGFQDSAYVQSMREKELAHFDEQQKMNDFRKRFKSRIADGLTETAFMKQYNCTENDLRMFREVQKEVNTEKVHGEAFLKAFQNPDFKR